MKWLKHKLYNWVNEIHTEKNTVTKSVGIALHDGSNSPTVDDTPVLNFRIFPAQNGLVLEFRHYDRKADRSYTSTFIIPEGEEVSEYVRQCLPMEMMKVSK